MRGMTGIITHPKFISFDNHTTITGITTRRKYQTLTETGRLNVTHIK